MMKGFKDEEGNQRIFLIPLIPLIHTTPTLITKILIFNFFYSTKHSLIFISLYLSFYSAAQILILAFVCSCLLKKVSSVSSVLIKLFLF